IPSTSRTGAPPATGTLSNGWPCPSDAATAIHFPSGDQDGVSRISNDSAMARGSVPSAAIMKRPARFPWRTTKAIRLPSGEMAGPAATPPSLPFQSSTSDPSLNFQRPSAAVGARGDRDVCLETKTDGVRDPPVHVHRKESGAQTVRPRCSVDQRAVVKKRGVGHSRVVIRQAFGRAAGRGNPPDVRVQIGHSADEVDEAAVPGPGEVVMVYARLLDEDLFRTAAVAVGDEDRVAGAGRVVDSSRSVRRPSDLYGVWEEGAR